MSFSDRRLSKYGPSCPKGSRHHSLEPGELPRELAAMSLLVRLDPVRVGILDCVLVELPDPLTAMSELLDWSFWGGGVAARASPDSALLSLAVAGQLTVALSAPFRSSPEGIILGIRDPASPDCEDKMGGVVGTLKTLCGTWEPTGLLSGCILVRQPGVDDENGSVVTVFGDFGRYCAECSAVDGLRTGLHCEVPSAPRCLCCCVVLRLVTGRGGTNTSPPTATPSFVSDISDSSSAILDVQLELLARLLLLTLAIHTYASHLSVKQLHNNIISPWYWYTRKQKHNNGVILDQILCNQHILSTFTMWQLSLQPSWTGYEYRPRSSGSVCSWKGNHSLTSHCSLYTASDISTYGYNGLCIADEHLTYAPLRSTAKEHCLSKSLGVAAAGFIEDGRPSWSSTDSSWELQVTQMQPLHCLLCYGSRECEKGVHGHPTHFWYSNVTIHPHVTAESDKLLNKNFSIFSLKFFRNFSVGAGASNMLLSGMPYGRNNITTVICEVCFGNLLVNTVYATLKLHGVCVHDSNENSINVNLRRRIDTITHARTHAQPFYGSMDFVNQVKKTPHFSFLD